MNVDLDVTSKMIDIYLKSESMNAFCKNLGPGKIGSCTCKYFLRDDMLQVTVVKFMVNL